MVAVIFDMDCVLVDSEPVILEAAMLGLQEYGVWAKPDDFTPFVGAGEDRFIGGVAEKYGVSYRKEMKKRVYEIYLDIVQDKIKVFQGVHELLSWLHGKGVKSALVSAADMIKVDANLKAAGISMELFGAVVSAENVKHKKPAPDVFIQSAQAIRVNPENCIVVEDAVNGIRAAKAGGMRCIAVTTSFTEEELAAEQPDWICTDIPAVERVLMRLIDGCGK